ncbi:winged helix-turn-helix domain-containing protein [Marivita hallyeonensis]|uniref:TolB amino-terminal domain-containing protein n=1 Tax=Marivita hallyeonensis TaxID=996342 RepID=A0A1M5W6X9_9RHOB|nr:winged helix-turn-helix domain-containing protein [Marivita hallyeonensis]SHH82934.1 TolB amino-terminal domain-containing protein [Marivita hallyeonensis]
MSDLQIDSVTRNVTLDGSVLTLGARAFDVLNYLSQNADRVVTKEDLLDHVWAGVLVEESNLSVQIAGLRKALGKDAIKTVPGVGYKLTMSAGAEPVASEPKAKPDLPDMPSLAVLPFANLTGDEGLRYMVDGIVNEITSALARVSSFFVISNTSTFTYRGQAVDLAQIGQDLGVRYVLEGSIQKADNRLRIFTQLVEAKTARMIWHERFDGTTEDIFDLQDRVAERVAGAIEPKMIWAEAARIQAKPTHNLAAYDLCMKAAPLVMRQNSLDNLEEGIGLLNQALALDPGFVRAKGLFCYAHTGSFAARWWSFEKARAALPLAEKLLDEGTDDPFALATAGHYIAYIGQDPHRGLIAVRRANALNPNSATISLLLGWVYNYLSDDDAAIEHLKRALRLSPLHPNIGITTSGIANAYFQKQDLETAIRYYEEALMQYPEFATIQLGLIGCYWKVGEHEKSAQMATWFRNKVPDMTVATFLRTRPHHNEFYRNAVVDALRANGFPED